MTIPTASPGPAVGWRPKTVRVLPTNQRMQRSLLQETPCCQVADLDSLKRVSGCTRRKDTRSTILSPGFGPRTEIRQGAFAYVTSHLRPWLWIGGITVS